MDFNHLEPKCHQYIVAGSIALLGVMCNMKHTVHFIVDEETGFLSQADIGSPSYCKSYM